MEYFFTSPLYYAINMRQNELLQFYLENQTYPVHIVNHMGISPIYYAVQCKNYVAIELLLRNGADPNYAGKGLLTPLMLAVIEEDLPLVTRLLNAGADPTIRLEDDGVLFKKGETALSLATRLGTLIPTHPTRLTKTQLDILHHLLQSPYLTPNIIFHTLQHAKTPLFKKYIMQCLPQYKHELSKIADVSNI